MFRIALRSWSRSGYALNQQNPHVTYVSNRWLYKPREKVVEPVTTEFLVRLLDIDEPAATCILKKNKIFNNIEQSRIAESHALCLEYGITNELLRHHSVILCLRPITLQQRILYYREAGIYAIQPHMIIPFSGTINLTVRELKDIQVLPSHVDVLKHMMSFLHEVPPDVAEPEPVQDDHSLYFIHVHCMRHYLKWKLELTQEQLDKIMGHKSRLKYRSFQMVKEMMDILEIDIGFTKDKIRRNHFMLSGNPGSTAEILKQFKDIGGLDMKVVLRKFPRILNSNVELLQAKVGLLQEFKISDIAMATTPDILTLSLKTVRERLIEIRTIPELVGHWNNPRMLKVIFYLKRAKERLQQMEQLGIRCSSLHMLVVGHKDFLRWSQEGSYRIKGTDLLRFLNFELGVDRKILRTLLLRHPWWCSIPFLHTHQTFAYLRDENYSNDDIIKNIHIVLYRRDQVQQVLEKLNSESTALSWEITPSHKLALCLYYIEKRYHFNGNGVWNCGPDELAAHNNDEEGNSLRQTSNM